MYSHRTSVLFILAFWVISMTWLTWTKILPSTRIGESPQHTDVLPNRPEKLPTIHWEILLNAEPIGWATHEVERLADGQGTVESVVHLEKLSLDLVVRQGFANLAMLATRGLGGSDYPLSLTVRNEIQLEHFGQLRSFECDVVEQNLGELIRLQGTVHNDDELVVKAYLLMPTSTAASPELLHELRFPLPAEKLLIDSLSPRPRFGRLRLGQSWTFETYNPLFPGRPMQTVNARVLGIQTIQRNAENIRTYHVTYERAGDDGLSVGKKIGDVWVSTDGTVIRQTATWGSLKLTFNRLATGPASLSGAAEGPSREEGAP